MPHASDPASVLIAKRVYLAVAVVLVLVALLVMIFGLPALGILGIVMTVVVFGLMLAFTAGN